MPNRLATACTVPGCPNIATDKGRCAKHPHAYRRRPDTRPSFALRGYGPDWPKLRALVLAEEPRCRSCDRPAIVVDHIDGSVHNADRSNLQALCKACHNRKTIAQTGAGWPRGERRRGVGGSIF